MAIRYRSNDEPTPSAITRKPPVGQIISPDAQRADEFFSGKKRKSTKPPERDEGDVEPKQEGRPVFTSKTHPVSLRLHPEVSDAWKKNEAQYSSLMARLITDYAFHQGWL